MALYRQEGSKVWWMSYSFLGRQIRKSTGATNKKIAESIYFKVKPILLKVLILKIAKERVKP